MKILPYELQNRIFGYASDELPPENSWKGKIYEIAEGGLSEGQIEELKKAARGMQAVTQAEIIDPILCDTDLFAANN